MKSTIKDPEDLSTLTFAAYRKLLLRDLDKLEREADPIPFFLLTKYEHPKSAKEEDDDAPGTKKALLIISDFTPNWVKLIKTNLAKRKQKDYFFGTCKLTLNNTNLAFQIKKKTGSLSDADKVLTKLFQNKYTFTFNEALTEGEELGIEVVSDVIEEVVVESKVFERFLAEVKKLQSFKSDDGVEAKQAILENIMKFATQWYDENPNAGLDTEKSAKERLSIDKVINGLAPHFYATKEEAELSAIKRRKHLLEKVRSSSPEEGHQLVKKKEFVELMKAELPLETLFKVLEDWDESSIVEVVEEVVPEVVQAEPEDVELFGPFYEEYVKSGEEEFLAPIEEPGFDKYITIPVNVAFTTKELRGYYKYRAKGIVKVTGETRRGQQVVYEFEDRNKKYRVLSQFVLGEASLRAVEDELFPPTPSPAHVNQGMLGDCYLLAALATLARKNPQAIVDMIADKVTYVVVRLFVVGDKEDGGHTYTPKFIKVKKTVVKTSSGTDLFAKDSLWVSMVEKAWALGKFRGDKVKTTNAQDSDYSGNSIESIAGGQSDFAYEVLTGKPAEGWTFYGSQYFSTKVMMENSPMGIQDDSGSSGKHVAISKTPWSANEVTAYTDGEYFKMVSFKILGNNRGLLAKWIRYIEKSENPVEKLFDREFGVGMGELTIEDFENVFNGKFYNKEGVKESCTKLDSSVAKPILAWIRSNAVYPESREKGAYSALQLAMYAKIKKDIDDGKMVSLGTKTQFAEKPTAGSMSATESVVKGIASGHAYSAFATKEEDSLYFIHIRNPWGMVVQRKVKARVRYNEINAALIEITEKLAAAQEELAELPENKLTTQLLRLMNSNSVPLNKVTTAIESVGEALQKETEKDAPDAEKVTFFKSLFDVLDKIALLVSQREKYNSEKSAIGVGGRISNKWLTVESTCDPDLPKGEFWLPLHQLSRYFNNIYSA